MSKKQYQQQSIANIEEDVQNTPQNTQIKELNKDISKNNLSTNITDSLNQRPSRKAKTKEAVMKHLNRDVELLAEKKQNKKNRNINIITDIQTKDRSSQLNKGNQVPGSQAGKSSIPKSQFDSQNMQSTPIMNDKIKQQIMSQSQSNNKEFAQINQQNERQTLKTESLPQQQKQIKQGKNSQSQINGQSSLKKKDVQQQKSLQQKREDTEIQFKKMDKNNIEQQIKNNKSNQLSQDDSKKILNIKKLTMAQIQKQQEEQIKNQSTSKKNQQQEQKNLKQSFKFDQVKLLDDNYKNCKIREEQKQDNFEQKKEQEADSETVDEDIDNINSQSNKEMENQENQNDYDSKDENDYEQEEDDDDDNDEIDDDENDHNDSEENISDNNLSKKGQEKKRIDKIKRKNKIYLANRALRIKMGKSGAQAASRRSIKKGKDACQRKLWNQNEDDAIVKLVSQFGTKRWTYLAQQLVDLYRISGRTGKQCRERWHNHLDPNIKKSPINNEEEIIIFDAHKIYGNKWADIAKLLDGRSDNCIKNYYYSTLRKHIRRINKSLKQCQVAKRLNLKLKTLTADILFPLVKDGKINYNQVKSIDQKKFEDLEHTMRMIFNHEDGQQVTSRGIIAAAQNRLKVEKQLEEMRERERTEQNLLFKRTKAQFQRSSKIIKNNKDNDEDQEDEYDIDEDDEEEIDDFNSKAENEHNINDKYTFKNAIQKNKKLLGKRLQNIQNLQKKNQKQELNQQIVSAQKKQKTQNEETESENDDIEEQQNKDIEEQQNKDIQLNINENMKRAETVTEQNNGENTQNQYILPNEVNSLKQNLQLNSNFLQNNSNKLQNQQKNNFYLHQLENITTEKQVQFANQVDISQTNYTQNVKQNTNKQIYETIDLNNNDNIFKDKRNNLEYSQRKVTNDVSEIQKNYQPLQNIQDNIIQDQKHHKKKKKNKKNKNIDGIRHKNQFKNNNYKSSYNFQGKNYFPFSNMDELGQYDFLDTNNNRIRSQNQNFMEMLQLTNQKSQSSSKMYAPINYDYNQKFRIKDQSNLTGQLSGFINTQNTPHTCFSNSLQQNNLSGGTNPGLPQIYPQQLMYQNPFFIQNINYQYGQHQNPFWQNQSFYNNFSQNLQQSLPKKNQSQMEHQKQFKNQISSFLNQNTSFLQDNNQTSQNKKKKKLKQNTVQKEKLSSKNNFTDSNNKEEQNKSQDSGKDNDRKLQKKNKVKSDEKEFKNNKQENNLPILYPPFMSHHESMSHFYALGPNPMMPIHPFYQKNGHFLNHYAMAPHLAMNPYFPLNQMPISSSQNYQQNNQRQERQNNYANQNRNQNYQNQFMMPVTPKNIKQQVFGGDKQTIGNQVTIEKNLNNMNQNFQTQLKRNGDEGRFLQDQDKKEKLSIHQVDKQLLFSKKSSSTNNLHGQQQPAQFNNNITLMINHYGPNAQTIQNSKTQNSKSQNEDNKIKNPEQSFKEQENQHCLSSKKQISAKKIDPLNINKNSINNTNNQLTFKNSFKPQKIGQLKDFFKGMMNSSGVTPSNNILNNQNQVPLISTSHLLHNGYGFSNFMFGGNFGNASKEACSYMQNNNSGMQRRNSFTNTNNTIAPQQPQIQNRLIQGTPRILLPQNKFNCVNTPKGGLLQFQNQQSEQLNGSLAQQLPSQRYFYLNSGNTFNGRNNFGSRINTKTNAQLTSNKQNNLITPKVNTVENDPETHRKLLEKMFQNIDKNKIDVQDNQINLEGAFKIKKSQHNEQQNLSKEGSTQKIQISNDKKDLNIKELQSEEYNIQKSTQKLSFTERDSFGLFYVNPQCITMNQFDQDMDNEHFENQNQNKDNNIQTPLLGVQSQQYECINNQENKSSCAEFKIEQQINQIQQLSNTKMKDLEIENLLMDSEIEQQEIKNTKLV